ncbi:MAG: ABC transporter substrate-binding protein [Nostoc sp. S4]|nr:ABC transporter substrate-binding protein [Nostoc sp. S4]
MATAVSSNNYTLAQEILRGVAQAQNEFNKNNGLNGRLLEMKIANDAGQEQQAKEVAGELVKDASIQWRHFMVRVTKRSQFHNRSRHPKHQRGLLWWLR